MKERSLIHHCPSTSSEGQNSFTKRTPKNAARKHHEHHERCRYCSLLQRKIRMQKIDEYPPLGMSGVTTFIAPFQLLSVGKNGLDHVTINIDLIPLTLLLQRFSKHQFSHPINPLIP
jgi:hypothetical protein